jgi:hypothetical protein
MTRKLQFSKYGLSEDPRGLHATWVIKGRRYLADILGAYYCEVRGVIMLKVRHFNGEPLPDISARFVDVLVR